MKFMIMIVNKHLHINCYLCASIVWYTLQDLVTIGILELLV